MRYRIGLATAVLLLVSHSGPALIGMGRSSLPVIAGRPAVATVNGEPISLGELELQLDDPADVKQLADGHARASDLERLNRLITVRLVVQEATAMGVPELADIRKQVDVTSRSILREVLMDTLVKDVVPDQAAVDALSKELAREWKTTSLLFADEQSANSTREAIDGGADFQEVAARAVAAKTAKTEGDDSYHRKKEFLPPIAAAIATLQVGQVSPVIQIQAGYVVVRVADIHDGDDAQARAEARKTITGQQRQAALARYEQDLRDKYVVVDKDVLASIDYEAKEPGIDALLKDARVVAEIKDSDPVTVGDLTDYLKMQFFHGGDPTGQAKRMNARKDVALDATLERRVLNLEAVRRGIDKAPAYLDRVKGFEDSLVFGTFVQKVIAPDNKMREEEVRTYYEQHLGAYSYPGMVRVRSLAFTTRGAAEEATEKLRKGTDYAWLAANAEEQIESAARAVAVPDGQLLTFESLPEGVRKVLVDSKQGDFRLYASPEGQFYVFAILSVVPPSAKPYEEVRDEIAKTLYGEKLGKGVEDYAARLRAVSKIEIYLKKTD